MTEVVARIGVDSYAVLYAREEGGEEAHIVPITALPFTFKRGEVNLMHAIQESKEDSDGLFCGSAKNIR